MKKLLGIIVLGLLFSVTAVEVVGLFSVDVSETIKNVVSVPIQALTSRPENFKDLKYSTKKNGRKWNDDESDNTNSYKRVKNIDVVFILVDRFKKQIASEGQKFALVKPIEVGLSSENYYSVKAGPIEGELIVTGQYSVLSKKLYHGMRVNYGQN